MFLLSALLAAPQTLGRRGGTEVRGSIAAAAWTTGSRSAESTATTEPASSWTRAAETSARARTSEAAAARTRAAKTSARRTCAWRTIFTRARFADGQIAAHERLRVELVDDLLGDGALGEFDKCKAARPPCFAIDRHDDVRGLGDRREVGSEIRFGCPVRKVPYEETDSHSLGEPDRFYLMLAANAEYGVSVLRWNASASGTPRAMSWRRATMPAPPISSSRRRAASALSA